MALTNPDRPLRKDAARNRQRILDAAKELFAERGLAVTLNDIAHHAGVGVGTVYRHFPDKDKLVDGIFEQEFEALVTMIDHALADPDPWRGLTSFLHGAADRQATNRGLKDLMNQSPEQMQRIGRIRTRLKPLIDELIVRAHAADRLRTDIVTEDMPIILEMTSAVIDAAGDIDPALYRRSLDIVLRGIATQPDEQPPLGAEPLAPDQVDHVISHSRRRRC